MAKLKRSARMTAERQKYATQTDNTLTELFDPVNQNVETIARIHRQMESEINHHQRRIEKVTAFIGRPRFLYMIVCIVLIWIAANVILVSIGLHAFDPEPFTWLLETINIGSLLMTTMILITQNRQSRVTEQRRHLELQFDMLIEQKVTKVLTMLEELRRDLPSVATTYDPEVEAMKQPVNPHEVLTSLDQMLTEVAEESRKEAPQKEKA